MMHSRVRGLAAVLCVTASHLSHAGSSSLTLSGLVDADSGSSYDVDASFAPADEWSIGAGVGHSDSNITGSEFSGRSLRLNTDLTLGGLTASVAAQSWKDSTQLKSDSLQGELGWLAESGFSVSAIFDDRNLKVDYQLRTATNQPRDAQVHFDGTGFGADVAYFGEQWHADARYVDYRYGDSLTRVRAVSSAPTTTRFPRLQTLIGSVATRAAGAPDREISATLGRTLRRTSLQGEWLLQRDALTQKDINSFSMRLGLRFNPHVELATTLGLTEGADSDNVAFGGLALTMRL